MKFLIFDGISVLYVFTLCLLLFVLMVIFTRRQVVRLRNNNARIKPILEFPFSKRTVEGINHQLENVENLRRSYQPRLTECETIAQHSNKPYVHRMIAVDEVKREIDTLMSRVNPEMNRQPGEATIDYLTRLRAKIPALPSTLCQRIAFLHESARFGTQKFDVEHLMELRSCLNQFVKIINKEENIGTVQATPSKNLVTSFYERINLSSSNRKNRTKFGGSDGGRLLAGNIAEERVALLPIGESTPTRNRLRRQSDSHQSLLQ